MELKVTLNMQAVEALPEHCFYSSERNQGVQYLQLYVQDLREPDQYGNDVTAYALEKRQDGQDGKYTFDKRYVGKGKKMPEKHWGK